MSRVLEMSIPGKFIVRECGPSCFRAEKPGDGYAYGYGFTREDAVRDLVIRNPRCVIIKDLGMRVEELPERKA